MARRRYRNAAPSSTLTGGVNASATSLVVVAVTGWPVTYPFTAVVDYGLSTVEVVLVTNVVGTTLTATRGYDSTTAVSHSAGATVQPMATAIDFDEASAHVNAVSAVHGISGSVVGTTDIQTLTNKTLTSPVLNNGSLTGTTTASTITSSAAVTGATVAATTSATVGTTLGVTGTATVGALSTGGAVTAVSTAISGAATVGGTLGVSGLATVASSAVTGNETVGGTLGVTGVSTLGVVNAASGTVTADPSAAKSLVNRDHFDGALTGQGWTTVTYGSGWTFVDSGGTYKGVQYRKIGSVCYLQGSLIKTGSASAVGSVLFTLPAGFRPADRQLFVILAAGPSGATPRRIDIKTTGDVIDAIGGAAVGDLVGFVMSFVTS